MSNGKEDVGLNSPPLRGHNAFQPQRMPKFIQFTPTALSLNGIWWQIKSLYVTQLRAVQPDLV